MDLRTIVLDVPTQDVISRDNDSVKVNAVLNFRAVAPDLAVIQVENFMRAERDKLNADIQDILDAQTDAWGIKVANVEIKHVDIGESMARAIACQAAQKLLEAAEILGQRPEAMQLRYLSTVNVIAGERSALLLSPSRSIASICWRIARMTPGVRVRDQECRASI